MPETTVCAYCAAVIPADAKTCPMCGADNQPDYLDKPELVEEAETLRPFVEPLPLADDTPPQPFKAQPYEAEPFKAQTYEAPPPTNSNTNRYILIGVIALVLVCLCIGAVSIAGLRGILGI